MVVSSITACQVRFTCPYSHTRCTHDQDLMFTAHRVTCHQTQRCDAMFFEARMSGVSVWARLVNLQVTNRDYEVLNDMFISDLVYTRRPFAFL